MNNKGQAAILGVIFVVVVFFFLWAMLFAGWISTWSGYMITDNNLTGIEAFLMANMNLWVMCGVLFGLLGFMYFGGSQ